MNLIVSKAAISSPRESGLTATSRPGDYLAVVVMLVYSVLTYGSIVGEDQIAAVVGVAMISYFLTFGVYYGVIMLAYRRHTFLLWGGIMVAIITAYLVSGLTDIWIMLTGWSMILFAGAIAGRLASTGKSLLNIYILSGATVVLFVIAQQAALWPGVMEAGATWFGQSLDDLEKTLIASGQNEVAVMDSISYSRKLAGGFIRLMPASSILSSLMQFSVAYLIFLTRLDRNQAAYGKQMPFCLWKMPFGFTPVVLIALVMRYLGSETVAVVADNVLAVMSVFYCLTGLALVEFYLKKAKVSRLVKWLFYLMLFFSQLIGFFVTALLGFIDSFTDWRKVDTEAGSDKVRE